MLSMIRSLATGRMSTSWSRNIAQRRKNPEAAKPTGVWSYPFSAPASPAR